MSKELSGHITRGVMPEVVDMYSKQDVRVIDYKTWQLQGTPYKMRGPKPVGKVEDSIVCLGSAATFGRLVHRPFAIQLSEKLSVPIFNFGIGGVRPHAYLSSEPIKNILKRCKAVIVEVMSARGYKTELFTPNNSHSNLGVGAAGLNLKPREDGTSFVDHVYMRAIEQQRHAELANAIREIRSTYISDMADLADIVGKKSILLYFSQRKPDYQSKPTGYLKWSGGFPHFVDQAVIDTIKVLFKSYIQHISKSGIPSPCLDKFTSEPVPIFVGTPDPTHNTYYPSQEMHDEVVSKLLPEVKSVL